MTGIRTIPGRRRRFGPGRSATAVAAALIAIAALAGCATRGTPAAAGKSQKPAPVPVFSRHSMAPRHGALFGASVQVTNYAQVNAQEDAQQAAVVSFEHTIRRKLAIDNLYVPWTPLSLTDAKWDLRHGSIPMLSWAPARTDQIADGGEDAMLRADARQLKSLHGPVLLRWFAEMDLGQNRNDAISPTSFIAAWRHMHDIFTRAGATNVRWVWCPSGTTFADGVARAYYPGKAYVDWICADGFNWAPQLPGAGWRSFEQIFSPFYQWGLSTGKPMLVGEFGALEGTPGAKAAWIKQAASQLQTQFPAIRAVVYFNSDHENFGQNYDWRVTTSRSALSAFRAFAHDPYFTARPPT